MNFVCAHVKVFVWDQAAANVPDWITSAPITSAPNGQPGKHDHPSIAKPTSELMYMLKALYPFIVAVSAF